MAARCSGQRRSGITLIETLATLVLVGIALPAVMRGITLSAQAASRSRHEAEATHLAEAKLNELLIQQNVALLSGSGDFGQSWPEYRWQVTAVSRDWGLYEAQMTVSWQERGQEYSVTLDGWMYPPGQVVQ
ncbi:MAG: type II secretion system protein [Phycisphaerales bacterium]|nr:type II secretion system protein [Phycisphaerales bacterium]